MTTAQIREGGQETRRWRKNKQDLERDDQENKGRLVKSHKCVSRKYEERVERAGQESSPDRPKPSKQRAKKSEESSSQEDSERERARSPKQRAMTFANSLLLLQVISSSCLSPRGVDD